jgi:hypothetical protein
MLISNNERLYMIDHHAVFALKPHRVILVLAFSYDMNSNYVDFE